MRSTTTLALAAALPLTYAQTLSNETILGVYMFHRHGDRTAKSTPPANLTTLGYREVWTSGDYYRSRYIASSAPYKISGIQTDVVKQSQISVSAPDDTVLQSSALGFLQGLYPPVGSGLDTSTLKNGTVVTAPLNGYQLIPVDLVATGGGSEDSGWLQGATGCAQSAISSNNYFLSAEYLNLLASTQTFYNGIAPVVNKTFNTSQVSYKNAYTVYDLINVASIHNASFDPTDIIDSSTFYQLSTLANAHEWGLAYNASDNMRAVTGMILAAEVVQFLNATLTSGGKQKIGIQFGAYGVFASFFGLADLPSTNPDFYGIADYASAMTFELFTNSSDVTAAYKTAEDVYVRFLWHNGTTSNTSEPVAYPLFGSGQEAIKWNDFTAAMGKFSIGTTEQWCTSCGNYTGTCAAYATTITPSSTSSSGNKRQGLSPAVGGVIGAMVTLAVILGAAALFLTIGGMTLVSKKKLSHGSGASAVGGSQMAKA